MKRISKGRGRLLTQPQVAELVRKTCARGNAASAQFVRSRFQKALVFRDFCALAQTVHIRAQSSAALAALCRFSNQISSNRYYMKKLNRWFVIAGMAWMAGLGAGSVFAQQ